MRAPSPSIRKFATVLHRAFLRRDSAQATLEFILVFPIALVFVMAIFNFSCLSIANQLAQYAAFTAARIAIVNPQNEDKMAFFNMIPLSPAKTDLVPTPPIPGGLDEILKMFLDVDQPAERALYAYATSYFDTTFFDVNGKVVEAGGQTRSNLIAKSSYVKTEASYLYFTPFPFLNELTQYLAQRNETYVIGWMPIHFHDPIKALKWWIFFGANPAAGPSIYQKAWAIDMIHNGTVVLPIYQTTLMGIN